MPGDRAFPSPSHRGPVPLGCHSPGTGAQSFISRNCQAPEDLLCLRTTKGRKWTLIRFQTDTAGPVPESSLAPCPQLLLLMANLLHCHSLLLSRSLVCLEIDGQSDRWTGQRAGGGWVPGVCPWVPPREQLFLSESGMGVTEPLWGVLAGEVPGRAWHR